MRRLALLILLALPLPLFGGTFTNPINPSADPWVGYADGNYYLATTQGHSVKLWKAASLKDLATSTPTTVFEKGRGVWAPEFHQLNGPHGKKWYLYFTKQETAKDESHRMWVMESTTNSIEGPYAAPVQIKTDPRDEFYAIDGTVWQHPNGKMYFLWAGHPGHRLFISEMKDPWTLKGKRQLIEASGFGCPEVREGPFMINRGDKWFLTYSACDTGKPDYKVGALWIDDRRDPMNPRAWKQIEKPILERSDENGVYGPGHHSYFKSPDGKEDWIAYHAKEVAEYTYENRSTRVQKIEWDKNGMPVPVVPLPLSAEIPLPSGDAGKE